MYKASPHFKKLKGYCHFTLKLQAKMNHLKTLILNGHSNMHPYFFQNIKKKINVMYYSIHKVSRNKMHLPIVNIS